MVGDTANYHSEKAADVELSLTLPDDELVPPDSSAQAGSSSFEPLHQTSTGANEGRAEAAKRTRHFGGNALRVLAATVALSPAGAALDISPLQAESSHAQGSIARVNTHGKKDIALTFDDGPSDITPEILSILRRDHVKATFFMIGRKVVANPKMAKEVVKEGHEIGNHTYDHVPLNALPSNDPRHMENGVKRPGPGVSDEVFRGAESIQDVTGVWPKLIREPAGLGRNSKPVQAAENFWGEISIGWTASFETALSHTKSVAATERWLVKHTEPGTIELAHEAHEPLGSLKAPKWDNRQTLRPLDGYIRTMQKKGYHFLTLSQLLKKGGVRY